MQPQPLSAIVMIARSSARLIQSDKSITPASIVAGAAAVCIPWQVATVAAKLLEAGVCIPCIDALNLLQIKSIAVSSQTKFACGMSRIVFFTGNSKTKFSLSKQTLLLLKRIMQEG